jgi:hypothetical protein
MHDDGSIELRLDFKGYSGWERQLLLAACDALAVLKAVSRRRHAAATQLLLGVLQRSDHTLQRTVYRLLLAATETKGVMLEVVRQAMEGIDKASGGRVKVGRALRCAALHPQPGAACDAPLSMACLDLVDAHCCTTGEQVDRSRLNKGMWEYHKKQYIGAPRSILLRSDAGSGAENVWRVPFQQKPMLKQAEQPPLPAAQAVPRLGNLPAAAAARPGRCGSCSVCKAVIGRQRRRQQQGQQQGQPVPPECSVQQLWDAAGNAAEFAVAEAETARVPDDIIAGYQQLHAIVMLSPTAEQVGGLLVAALPPTTSMLPRQASWGRRWAVAGS